MDELIERLRKLVEYNCREVIDDGHSVQVEAVGGAENLLFEIRCDDAGLMIGRGGKTIIGLLALVRGACRAVSAEAKAPPIR
jgi:predicted RNA-binding protein YlqC (UPF0109 family)